MQPRSERLLHWKRQRGFDRFILVLGSMVWVLGGLLAPPVWSQDSESLAEEVAQFPQSSQEVPPALLTDEAVVAILPFEIHSARPIQHLVEALPSLLSARLEATEKVAVIAPAKLAEFLPEDGQVDHSDSGLRALATKLKAAGVVSASVTELANRFSLDVRFVSADPARRSRNLTYTAEGETELIAKLGSVSEQVVAAVSGDDADRVIGVQILGAGGLEPQFRALVSSLAGTEYDPDKVEADRKLLTQQERVAQVTVSTERRAGGILFDLPGSAFGGDRCCLRRHSTGRGCSRGTHSWKSSN